MGHRHLPNPSLTFEIDQDQNQYHGTAEESYSTTGRVVAAENGSYAYPTEHRVTNGGYSASQQDFDGRLVEHSSSGFRLGGHYTQPAFSGSSYNPSPHFLTARSNNITPENNAGHAHPNFHNWPTTNEIEGGSLAPTMGIIRGPLKRKSPDNSVVFEGGGNTSRFYAAGSSSSSESWPEKPTVNHQAYCSSSNSLPPCWSDGISIGSEVFQRNVRSRSRLDLESNTWRSYPSTYSSSNHHCPMTQPISRPQTVDNTNLNTSVHAPNHNTMFPAAHWRLQTSEYNGRNHETTQFFAGTNPTEIGGHYHGSILSRNPVLPPQYPHVPHPQAERESGMSYSQGAIPPYAADSSFTCLGNEASSSQNNLHHLSESYSSQHSMPLPTRGWHSNHRDSRSRRFHRHSIIVDGHDRMRSEAFTIEDRSSMSGSRNMFDQYRDMRLDVDNMSYEELLALGERIGSVSTGLSEEVVPKCLMVKTYCLSDCNAEEASCAVCLEKYEKGEEIGRMRKCGHEYHVGCVKRWLTMKNVCPICKGPAKTDDEDHNS